MRNMTEIGRLVIVALVAFLVALGGAAPVAHADDDDDHKKHLVIGSIHVDAGAHQIVINGVNLTRRQRTTQVVLAGSPLGVVSAHPTQVAASLPIDIQPGDYRLMVSTGNGDSRTDFWDLTIGGAGLQGPPGPAGQNGKDGAPGLNGQNGMDGAAVAAVRRQAWRATTFSDAASVRARLAVTNARAGLLALYTGGTLAHEARLVLEPLIGPVGGNVGTAATSAHRVMDLGADEFTRGRPHPMIDPSARDGLVREAGRTAGVGVLLLDLVLGRAAHPDPARSLAAAIGDARREAERDGRALRVVASVVGTDADPQDRAAQIDALKHAGVEVLPSNTQAARFAALALDPTLAPKILGDT
ncbi:MAG: hypothetical protein FJZ38_11270 [Candidatus Rokubacteria bacterium]|nr:hypothetical protein [Candidatus Rokubacteria bacterium]